MKALSPSLGAHLTTGATTLAWCWRVIRADGVVLGFTDHDQPLAFDGTTFEPEAGFIASEIRAGSEMAVDAQDAEGVLSSDRITETDILDGRYDSAEVEVWRVNWQNVAQRVLMRRGSIGEVRRGRVAFVAEMVSLAHVINQTVGRTYQASCDATLGDARCGVDLDSPAFSGTGAVLAVQRARAFTVVGLESFAVGLFTFGTVEWLTGANAGRVAEVALHTTLGGEVQLQLLQEPVRAVADGDTLIARAGCDKRIETCAARFGNVENFRGFPYIPGQDAVIRYANQGQGGDGEPL